MKRKVAALLSLVLIVTALAPMMASAALYQAYIKTGDYGPANMRADLSTNSELVGKVPYGKQVVVLDYYADNTWACVEYNGKQGYMLSRFLVYEKPSPKPVNPAPSPSNNDDVMRMFEGFQDTHYDAIVSASTPGNFAHMRWAPSKKMKIIRNIYDGEQLEVLAQNNTWCQIRVPSTGQTGFMMRYFIREIGYGSASGEVGYGISNESAED